MVDSLEVVVYLQGHILLTGVVFNEIILMPVVERLPKQGFP